MRPVHWLLAAALAATAGAALVPVSKTELPLQAAARERWEEPAMPVRIENSALAAQVIGAGFWGGAVGMAGASPVAPVELPLRWRIAAIVSDTGGGGAALISHAGGARPPQLLRVGDALPSGQRIVSIAAGEVCVLQGKRRLRLGVERSDE